MPKTQQYLINIANMSLIRQLQLNKRENKKRMIKCLKILELYKKLEKMAHNGQVNSIMQLAKISANKMILYWNRLLLTYKDSKNEH